MRKLVSTVALCTALAACAHSGEPGGPDTTGVNEPAGAAPVAAAPADLIGSKLGASLDRADRAALQAATASALENSPPNQVLPWRDATSGNYGTVTPGPVQQVASGQYCREFQQTIIAGGREQQGRGRACRQPDSSWKMVP